jgi:hypothetical protein
MDAPNFLSFLRAERSHGNARGLPQVGNRDSLPIHLLEIFSLLVQIGSFGLVTGWDNTRQRAWCQPIGGSLSSARDGQCDHHFGTISRWQEP